MRARARSLQRLEAKETPSVRPLHSDQDGISSAALGSEEMGSLTALKAMLLGFLHWAAEEDGGFKQDLQIIFKNCQSPKHLFGLNIILIQSFLQC